MNVRQLLVTSVALGFVVLSGCGSSSSGEGSKSPDDVITRDKDTDMQSNGSATDDRPANDTKEMPHGARSTSDNSVPEDYELTQRDCIELGKHYAVVQKADQMLGLSPKLTAEQRATGEKSIDDGVVVLRERWENSCMSTLVGGVVDRASLKCAMTSKTVVAFDECINGKPAAK